MMNIEDIECIHQIRSGNTGAFTIIVNRYKNSVFSIVSKIIGDTQHAEDITQEVFIKVFQSLDKFKEKSKFSTWLYSITYNTTIGATRKMKNRQLPLKDDVEDSELSDELDGVSKEDKLQCLEIVLQQMPTDDSLLITLYYMENQPIASISEITGLTQSNVKIRLHRIRKYMNFEINKLLAEQ